MQRRLPARVRILASVAVAIAVHIAFSDDVEGIRVRVLGSLPTIGRPGGIFGRAPEVFADLELQGRIVAWRALRTKALGAEGRVAVSVVDYRPKTQIAIIGAGRESGLAVLDPVVVPAGLLGFVEAIQPHLARVRLLAAPHARIAVTLAESRPGLPGELNGLNAVLEGTGEGGRLVEGALLSEFQVGDRLSATIDAAEAGAPPRAMPVGAVTKAGPTPHVRLFAGPGDLGLVAVPANREPGAPPFTDALLEVRAAPLFSSGGALLAGPPSAAMTAGCAIHAHGRYLGRIVRVSGNAAIASRLADRGHRVFVRWLAPGNRSSTGELVSIGDGRFRLEGGGGDGGAPTILGVTAGGQDLVPPDLAVGFLDRDGSDWRLRDPVTEWPRVVTVPVFSFGDELRQLGPR